MFPFQHARAKEDLSRWHTVQYRRVRFARAPQDPGGVPHTRTGGAITRGTEGTGASAGIQCNIATCFQPPPPLFLILWTCCAPLPHRRKTYLSDHWQGYYRFVRKQL